MNKYQNMKIEINEQQPLDEVVKELERLGYGYWGLDEGCWVSTSFKNKQFTTFDTDIRFNNGEVLTTLAQLKAMEN